MEKDKSASNNSSAYESYKENFKWVHNLNFSKKLKKLYTQYPLKSWKNIVFKKESLYYQNIVYKILKKDIFKDCMKIKTEK